MRRLLPFFLLLAAAPAGARTPNAWDGWRAALARDCPERHVDWACDGCWDELIGAFQATLPRRVAARVDAVADERRVCREERAGFSCEMGAYLKAWRRLGLLGHFTRWGCKTVKCEEGDLCSRFPGLAG
jgi:hypothetical protein